MIIRNNATKIEYRLSKSDWEKMGAKKLFTVVSEVDEEDLVPQIIDNNLRPNTGQTKTITLKKDKKS